MGKAKEREKKGTKKGLSGGWGNDTRFGKVRGMKRKNLPSPASLLDGRQLGRAKDLVAMDIDLLSFP